MSAVLESLPSRTLRNDELDEIRDVRGVECVHLRYGIGPHQAPPERTDAAQFVVFLYNGPAVGCHFDPETEEWTKTESIDCVPHDDDDHYRAIEQIDDLLEDLRGDNQAYGEAIDALQEGAS